MSAENEENGLLIGLRLSPKMTQETGHCLCTLLNAIILLASEFVHQYSCPVWTSRLSQFEAQTESRSPHRSDKGEEIKSLRAASIFIHRVRRR